MSGIYQGGPAFPRPPIGQDCGRPYGEQAGMTLRQYYAGQALPGLIAALWAHRDYDHWKIANFAEAAFDAADAMIAHEARE